MSRSTLFRSPWFAPVLGSVLVVPFVLNGCGGSSSGPVVNPTATPAATTVPTAAPTATTTPTPAPLVSVPVNLSNNQRGTLEISSIISNQLIGALIVSAPTAPNAAQVGASAFTFALPTGRYNFRGTITPPRTFQGSGTGPNGFRFAVDGLLPTTSQTGTYTIRANNQTATGTIPVAAFPFPTQ